MLIFIMFESMGNYLVQSREVSEAGSRNVIPARYGKQKAVDIAANALHSTKRPIMYITKVAPLPSKLRIVPASALSFAV